MSVDLLSPAAAIEEEPRVLSRIRSPETHLAIWQRARPEGLAWVDRLAWDAIDDLDFPVAVEALATEVGDGLAEAGYPQDARGDALRDEICGLARAFATIMACAAVTIRLEVVTTDACRKFHADAVTARLLTTLSGPGTDWIEAAQPDRIQRLSAGDVALFKGRIWAGEPAILHRSPPMAGSGGTRLLLVIDPFDPAVTCDQAGDPA